MHPIRSIRSAGEILGGKASRRQLEQVVQQQPPGRFPTSKSISLMQQSVCISTSALPACAVICPAASPDRLTETIIKKQFKRTLLRFIQTQSTEENWIMNPGESIFVIVLLSFHLQTHPRIIQTFASAQR